MESDRLRMTTVLETTPGTTPSTPRMRRWRTRGEDLKYRPTFVRSDSLRDDRMEADPIKVNEVNEGPVRFEFSYPFPLTPESIALQNAMRAAWVQTPERDNDGTADSVITAVTAASDTYTVTTGAAFVEGMLVRATGFTNAGNNLIFRAESGSGATAVVAPSSPGLTDEAAPPAAARLKVVGFQGASGDITAAAAGLASTLLDFTTLGLVPGMWLKIGGTATGDKFATAALNAWVRISGTITANAIPLDNLPSGWTTDAGTSKTIKVWFGDYIRNGTTEYAQTIERGFMGQTTPTYIIQRGMEVNELSLEFPSEDKVVGVFTYMGFTGEQTTTSLDASPDAETTEPIMATHVNVGRVAEAGSVVGSPNWIRDMSIRLNNNLRRILDIQTVGTVAMRAGKCNVTGQSNHYFGSNAFLAKLLAGTVTNYNVRVAKDSRAFTITLPRTTLMDGAPSASAENQDSMTPMQFQASKDSTTSCHIQFDRHEYYEA